MGLVAVILESTNLDRACFPNLGSFERWAITLRMDVALGRRGQVEPGSQLVVKGADSFWARQVGVPRLCHQGH